MFQYFKNIFLFGNAHLTTNLTLENPECSSAQLSQGLKPKLSATMFARTPNPK